MGESKRRKAADPTYGQPKRGIVVCPPTVVSQIGSRKLPGGLDHQALRFWLLFFDKMIWPNSNAIQFTNGPEEDFLESCGILSKPIYTYQVFQPQDLGLIQVRAFTDMDSKEPGLWSLAQGENSLFLDNNFLLPDQGAMLEFLSAVPIPDRDVPLQEVLEFRRRRWDELGHLRFEFEGLVEKVDAAEDREAEIQKHVTAIDRACADAIRVSHEWQFPVRLTDFALNYELRPFVNIAAAVVSGGLALDQGLPSTTVALYGVGAALAAAAPSIKLSGGLGWKGLKRRMGPYRYVHKIHHELF